MIIDDLRMLSGEEIETDLCLIGSGPAGWVIAKELQGTGIRALVLESGGREPFESAHDHFDIESVGAPLLNGGRNRTLGGTSHTWSGRLIPLDEIDYEARSWVPRSGWPFGAAEVAPYLDRASEYLGGGAYRFDGTRSTSEHSLEDPALDSTRLRSVTWEETQSIRFGDRIRSAKSPDLRVLVNATVMHLTTDPSGEHLESIEVTDGSRRTVIRARAVVLCAGGIENARILLYSNRILEAGVGNAFDVVGRYFMDHPKFPDFLVRFDVRDAERIYALLGSHRIHAWNASRIVTHGFALSPELQRRDGLLNAAAWPSISMAPDDPTEALLHLARGSRDVADVRALVRNPAMTLRALRSIAGRAIPRRNITATGLNATSEQRPDAESRVTLSGRRDSLGRPISRIDWRIGTQEIESQAALARAIVASASRLGLRNVRAAQWIDDGRRDGVSFIDSCHPTGTTRMADSPRDGVVDADCRVHGVDRLYVAGSSVFPTGGHGNPTLMIVALAIRLARHLKAELAKPSITLDEDHTMEKLSSESRNLVAVTGATGFIGGRLVEKLLEQGANVVCFVRDSASGERLRAAGAIVRALDLSDAYAVRAALEGVDVVHHCAYDWQDEGWNLAALRALLAGCRSNGCSRLVLLSSFVVYSLPADGIVTEETFADASDAGYAHTKRLLEGELLRAVRVDGVPATILQPTIVYGPRAQGWTQVPAERLHFGSVVLPDSGSGICNAVYVDDVVAAMMLAAREPAAIGQRFLISGPERLTWADYYTQIARSIGAAGPKFRPSADIIRGSTRLHRLLRLVRDPEAFLRRVAASGPGRKLLKLILVPLSPELHVRVNGRLLKPESRRLGFVHLPRAHDIGFLNGRYIISSRKAQDELKYAARYDFSAGMGPTGEFLRSQLKVPPTPTVRA